MLISIIIMLFAIITLILTYGAKKISSVITKGEPSDDIAYKIKIIALFIGIADFLTALLFLK